MSAIKHYQTVFKFKEEQLKTRNRRRPMLLLGEIQEKLLN